LLTPSCHQLEEVKVQANKVNNRAAGIVRMTNTQINSVPTLGGESDVLKAYQSMPGVAVGAEGRSDIYVRGGGHDQNLFILDDIPLYYINHLGGFVSVFNSDVIKDSKIIKGGFPAKYGNRLSSVIDIRMKDGNNKSLQGSASIGLISSKISLEGPLNTESTTFMISARRLMWDVFVMKPLSAILNSGDLITGYTFYDINAKVKHKLSDKDYLYFSFYNGDDRISTTFNIDKASKKNELQKWGNLLAAIRYNRIHSKNLFSNSTISHTKFRYLSDSKYNDLSEDFEQAYQTSLSSSINDLMVKSSFEYFKSNHYKLDFGGGFTIHNFQPGKQTIEEISEASRIDTTFNQSILHSYEGFLYLENQIKLGSKININLGLRASNYSIQQESFNSLEPRFIIDYSVLKNVTANFSFTSMTQNVHLLDYPNFGLPNSDIWVPTTTDMNPESANQVSSGILWESADSKYEISLEAYWKNMKNLVALNKSKSISHATNWYENVLNNGKGKSYGGELMLSKNTGQFTGWLSYTYSRSFRQFEELNNGNWYRFKYDRPHSLNINLSYAFSESLNLSAMWTFQSGSLITLNNVTTNSPDFNYNRNTYHLDIYSEKNNIRMESYHRLDVGLEKHKQKKRGETVWRFSIYNLYNKLNPYYYYWGTKKVDGVEHDQLYQKSLFPIIPSVSYTWSW
jgi:hypothetical protein